MRSIILYSIVLSRSQLYSIVYLLLCQYNTIQCYVQICQSIGQPSKGGTGAGVGWRIRVDVNKT